MTKVLYGGTIPSTQQTVLSIYEGGDDNPLYNPTNYLNRLYFDSRLDYINIVGQADVSITFNYRAVVSVSSGKKSNTQAVQTGTVSTVIGAHGGSYRPAFAGYDLDTGRAITGNMFIQSVSNTSFRLCYLLIDNTYLYIIERWFVRLNALPSITKNFRFFAFNKPAT